MLLALAIILIYKSRLYSSKLDLNTLIESLSEYIISWRKYNRFKGITASTAKHQNVYLLIPRLNSIPWTIRVVKFYRIVSDRAKSVSTYKREKETSIIIIKSRGFDTEVYSMSSDCHKLDYPQSMEKLKNISLRLTERYLISANRYKNYTIPSPIGKGFICGDALVVSFSSEEIPSLDLIPKIVELLLDFTERLK